MAKEEVSETAKATELVEPVGTKKAAPMTRDGFLKKLFDLLLLEDPT
jgi:hypothetical protein